MSATTPHNAYEYHTPVATYRCPRCGETHLAVVRGDPHAERVGCAHCPTVTRNHELVAFAVLDVPPHEVELDGRLDDYPAVNEARYHDYRAVVVDGERPTDRADERGVSASTVRANVARARQDITM